MRRVEKKINSAIVWQGASRFDASPIVAIVTGLGRRSKNQKTGPMAQLWIMRSDVSPVEAVQTGSDYAICWSCVHRGTTSTRSCYVQVGKAPLAIWRAFRAGHYPTITPRDAADIARSRGLRMRLGAYGDPAALPTQILQELTIGLHWTGYTHAWAISPEYRPWLMASVDTPGDLAIARAAGWRTFRTRLASDDLHDREITCPASVEAGQRTTCSDCRLCAGTRPEDTRASIAILAHGSGTRNYIALRAVR